jgi:hypothetical protein
MLERCGSPTSRSGRPHPTEEELFTATCLLVHLLAASSPAQAA